MDTSFYWTGAMKEWEIRRLIYLKNNPEPDDVIMTDTFMPQLQGKKVIIHSPETMQASGVDDSIVIYFKTEWKGFVIYPQKSYAVALVYARLLEKYFSEHFYDTLNHPLLLLGDKFFVPYSENRELYDKVIAKMNEQELWDFEISTIPQVQTTVDYFKKEMMLV